MTMHVKTVLRSSAIAVISGAIAYPVMAQPVPTQSSNVCLQRVAEAMVVATRDLTVTGAGPMDASTGVRTLFIRNNRTGQRAECKVNTVSHYVLSVQVAGQPTTPSRPSMNTLVSNCTQRVAEEMVVATRDIQFVNAGPVSAESGAQTMTFRNSRSGQRAECRISTLDGTVLSVRLVGQNQNPSMNTLINNCTQRVAEEMVVATRDVKLVTTGSVNDAGIQTMTFRNTRSGQRAECRINTANGTVVSVRLIR